MIGDNLNLKGESLIQVFIPRPTPDESDKVYKEVVDKIMSDYYPILTGFMEKQQLIKIAHDCKTIEELEALKYHLIPDDFFEVIAGKLNAVDSINDTERLFLLAQIGDRIIFSAKQWTNQVMHQRAQAIARDKPKILL